MVLSKISERKQRVVIAVTGEGDARRRLEELGFVPGAKVRVLSRAGDGVIVDIRGSRVAIDSRLADCIVV
ncbi:MAG: ferrous iron transport protein A [Eggerthellaceae bacterium]